MSWIERLLRRHPQNLYWWERVVLYLIKKLWKCYYYRPFFQGIERLRFNRFYVGVKQGKSCFMAWAKTTPIKGPDAVAEPEEGGVWVSIGQTRDQAIQSLLSELSKL